MLRQALPSRGSVKPQAQVYCRWNSGMSSRSLTAPQPKQRRVGLTLFTMSKLRHTPQLLHCDVANGQEPPYGC